MASSTTPSSTTEDDTRIIAHFDLDAFYVACERELNPLLINLPVAVSQYNPWAKDILQQDIHSDEVQTRLVVHPASDNNHKNNNGGLIAVSYEARAEGVKRGDRGLDAVQKCPQLNIVQVPVKRGKADLTMYRNASFRVMEALVSAIQCSIEDILSTSNKDIKVEKASIDEIYLDLTSPVKQTTLKIMEYQHALLHKNNNNAQNYESSMDFKISQNDNRNNSKTDNCPDEHDDHERKGCISNNPKSQQYNDGQRIWLDIVRLGSGSTTIGGVEVMSDATLAAHKLDKKQVRQGSHLQVLDTCVENNVLDDGSFSWWNRPLQQWHKAEIGLAVASAITFKARETVTSLFRPPEDNDIFTLSAGISLNKTLAKLASGLKKPNRQTIINSLDESSLSKLFHPLPIGRLKGLGGKFGQQVCAALNVKTIGDLSNIPLTKLEATFPPTAADNIEVPVAKYLFSIARGICTEEVSERTVEKSMSSGKTFRGSLALPVSDEGLIKIWVDKLCGGLIERLETDWRDNNRKPTLLVLSIRLDVSSSAPISRSFQIPSNFDDFVAATMKILWRMPLSKKDKIMGMCISASSFIKVATGKSSIMGAFQRVQVNNNLPDQTIDENALRDPNHHQSKAIILSSNADMKHGNEMKIESKVSPISTSKQTSTLLSKKSKEVSLKDLWSKGEQSFCNNNGGHDGLNKPLHSFLSGDSLPSVKQPTPSTCLDKIVHEKSITTISLNMTKISKTKNKNKNNVSMKQWLIGNKRSASTDSHRKAVKKKHSPSISNNRFVTLKADDIDRTVLCELPDDIQRMIADDLKWVKKQKKTLHSFFPCQTK